MSLPDRYPQIKQHVDSSFVGAGQLPYSHIPSTLRATAFPLSTVTHEWNNHAYGISATVSVSGSPTSDIMVMTIDEGSLDSRTARKSSSKMSVDPPPLTGTYSRTSSRMSVDPPSPNVYQSTQHSTSRMSVDVPSPHWKRGSSDRMLPDEIQTYHRPKSPPNQPYTPAPFTSHTPLPTTGYPHGASAHVPKAYAHKSGLRLISSFPTTISQTRFLSHGTRSPRGEAKLTPSSPPPSSFLQHTQGKDKYNIVSPATSALPRSPASDRVLPPKTVSQKHETPASRQGYRSPSAKRETIHSPIIQGRVRARGSSSGDEVSHKRFCVRQHSPPIALLATDPRPACDPSPQPAQSLSPIDEAQWLPPMKQQLETARQSQLKAKFRRFKAIIGGAVSDIKQAIMPYNKDHRKRKITRTRSGSSKSFAGVPDYLRLAAGLDMPSNPTSAPRYHQRTSPDIGKGIDITWTNISLCDSPTSLHEDYGTTHDEAPRLSLPLPRINEPLRSSRSDYGTSRGDPVSRLENPSNDAVELCTGTAANLTVPSLWRRTADAFDERGVVVPRIPNSNNLHRTSNRLTKM